jgi:DeoR/GlpR family transcriptional regulator of sugar metabolism
MLDTGSTTLEVARAVAVRPLPLTIITNSYPAATILAASALLRVIMPPGEFTAAESMVNGFETNEFIRRFNANICVTGATGVTLGGPADANLEATRLKRTMISRSHRTILLADHSKFERYALETVCPWNEIATVITDRQPSAAFREVFELQGVELIVAGEDGTERGK